MTSILIVDDDPGHRSMLETLLAGWGYAITSAGDGAEAVENIAAGPFDAVLMDVRMAGMDGLTALKKIMELNSAIPVIIMTAYGSVDTAVQALKTGAFDYLLKPLDFELLRHTLDQALEHTRLRAENLDLKKALSTGDGFASIVGKSEAMRDCVALASQVAPSEATVLITGESGTGKELIARAIHAESPRAPEPFIAVNCAALPDSLLESELFGHEKGAFTGAEKARAGRFIAADGGTLFLDEVGEMALPVQAKLLRVIQEGEVSRLGSDKPVAVDVRMLAATNRDLSADVREGRFREDLFYRLNVVAVHVPPLRDRRGDIPLLASHFLERYAARNKKTVKGFTPEAMDRMSRYGWPGNVRELENAVERAVVLATAEYVDAPQLPPEVAHAGETSECAPEADSAATLDDVERSTILRTLRETDGNKSEAARRLGITRATLHKKLKRYGES
ncbi:sigma-54-dependent transcriptional regulator [Oceanidesulfovibrio marinus]|uniref:Sigma-54-dependent Fis family transcriptional regulator n=1 Tax=Oceanidesulfovibrio marinus TaxID=370038 RepID=A0ABX6NHK0_9BACT|nr:sigma-54 dependent transcriptional regulator [Oceanidesulfovibrio marinus]QJT10111.1 sigma-54-dependent Fis family transcriptional regulator [Oceanidesulfovibrio marinus]